MTAATPQQYFHAFGQTPDGQSVLDDLQTRFGGPAFVAGQPDLTAYNCGARAVLEHILLQLAQVEPMPRPRS